VQPGGQQSCFWPCTLRGLVELLLRGIRAQCLLQQTA
jgi:hypothetical protein